MDIATPEMIRNVRQSAVNELMHRIDNGYQQRGDWPGYKIAPWDDRIVYLNWIKVVAADYLAELRVGLTTRWDGRIYKLTVSRINEDSTSTPFPGFLYVATSHEVMVAMREFDIATDNRGWPRAINIEVVPEHFDDVMGKPAATPIRGWWLNYAQGARMFGPSNDTDR